MSKNPCTQTVAAHILAVMSFAQREGPAVDLDTLCASVRARRADVRRALRALYREDMIDLSRMKVTLAGFAIGTALETRQLRSLRHPSARHTVAA